MNRAWVLAALLPLLCACCAARPGSGVIQRGEPPTFAEAAAAYNQRAAHFSTLWSRAVVRVWYTDDSGRARQEQGEGILQVHLPGRVALSLRKAGQLGLWFGADGERYWVIDVMDDRTATVGRTDDPDSEIGFGLRPSALVRLLGITTLPTDGATQWSDDGRLLGLTFEADGGFQRVWVDPATLLPAKIEMYDGARRPVAVADLARFMSAEMRGFGPIAPRVPTEVTALHAPSGTVLKFDLYGPRDEGVSPEAFDFEALARTLGVRHVRTADERRSLTPP